MIEKVILVDKKDNEHARRNSSTSGRRSPLPPAGSGRKRIETHRGGDRDGRSKPCRLRVQQH